MLRQKAEASWLKEGDRNTEFFHKLVQGRWRSNNISFVNTSRDKVEEVVEVKSAVKDFFVENFEESLFDKPALDDVGMKKLSKEDKTF
ncbi:unnamed protein product [Lathyrus sativus]|nr:unnamed protein product [Lathyrus sativus]